MESVEQFIELFQGRTDAYGQGGARPYAVRSPLSLGRWESHLLDLDGALGIYPLRDDLTVRWGCTDIDSGETLVMARNLHQVLAHLGVVAWVERSRSKGHHVWVFADDWVPAQDMRNMLLFAHQVAGVPPTEVNPKQTALDKVELGNWVRLPYPYALGKNYANLGRQVVIGWDTDEPLDFDLWLEVALRNRTPLGTIQRIAAMYVPPAPKAPPVAIQGSYQGDLEVLRQKLGGLANRIFLEGPLQARNGKAGRDRSGTLSRLALLMAEEGQLSPAEALALLRDADMRWGKFYDRADCEEQLQRIIEWGWSTAS